MTLNELKEEIGYSKMSQQLQINIDNRIKYYDSIYLKTLDTLGRIRAKYNFDTIHKHYCDGQYSSGEIHLEFVTGVGLDYSIILCLNMGGGVDDDLEFGKIIEMMDMKYFIWDTLTDAESDIYYEISERLFYTWLAKSWQQVDGWETGLKVSIAEGSAAQFFSLIDYSWDGYSKYLGFDDNPKRINSLNRTKLSLVEIYRRTEKNKVN